MSLKDAKASLHQIQSRIKLRNLEEYPGPPCQCECRNYINQLKIDIESLYTLARDQGLTVQLLTEQIEQLQLLTEQIKNQNSHSQF